MGFALYTPNGTYQALLEPACLSYLFPLLHLFAASRIASSYFSSAYEIHKLVECLETMFLDSGTFRRPGIFTRI